MKKFRQSSSFFFFFAREERVRDKKKSHLFYVEDTCLVAAAGSFRSPLEASRKLFDARRHDALSDEQFNERMKNVVMRFFFVQKSSSFFFFFLIKKKGEKKRGKKIRETTKEKSNKKQRANNNHHVLLRRLALAERRARERLGAAIERRFSFPNARFDVRVAVFARRFRSERVFFLNSALCDRLVSPM